MPKSLTDKEGLDMAYKEPSGLYYNKGVEYVAGTRTLGDWARNPLILAGLTSKLPRYQDLEKAYASQPFERVVGHSMGGSVALEFQSKHHSVQSETYGAPVLSFTPSRHRHRDILDPVSLFDLGADSAHFTFPHSYKGN